MNEILLTVLVVITVTLICLILSSMIVLAPSYWSYRKTFKELKHKKFYINIDHIYSRGYGEHDDNFVCFLKRDENNNSTYDGSEFRLTRNHYLHQSYVTYFSPYSLYWLLKYRRWFKKNVDLKTIQEY